MKRHVGWRCSLWLKLQICFHRNTNNKRDIEAILDLLALCGFWDCRFCELSVREQPGQKKELSLTLSGAALSQAIIAKALYLSCMPVTLSGCSTLPMMSHLRDLDLIYYPSWEWTIAGVYGWWVLSRRPRHRRAHATSQPQGRSCGRSEGHSIGSRGQRPKQAGPVKAFGYQCPC
jgi:hypothetical protein